MAALLEQIIVLTQILENVYKPAPLNHIDKMKNIKFKAPNLLEKFIIDEDCNAILKSLLDGSNQIIQKYLPYNDA